jgi:hypothetical protein
MTISELKHSLAAHPDQPLTFRLPDGESIPAHFHITEVGFVKKHGLLSQVPLESVTSGEDGVTLELTNRRTDCLAKDVCGVGEDDACCGPGCC